jgi:hypothetical protein
MRQNFAIRIYQTGGNFGAADIHANKYPLTWRASGHFAKSSQ